MRNAATAKSRDAYRDYEHAVRDTVREFYRLNHAHQTHGFARAKQAEFLRFDRRTMTPWEALDYLNTLVDDSDPDIALPQIDHLLQTAEAIRADGHPEWMVLTGFIHDLGKVLCLFGEPQWAVVGDTFPTGCPYSPRIVYSEFFAANPDSARSRFPERHGHLRAELRARERADVLGARRVPISPDEGLPAAARAVHDPLPLVLRVAPRGRVRLAHGRHGPRDAAVGTQVQPVRPLLEVAAAAAARRAATVLRGPAREVPAAGVEFLSRPGFRVRSTQATAHLSPRDLALALAVVAVWGFAFVPIKVALVEVPPFALAAVRFFCASVPMVFFIRRPTMPWRSIAAYGLAIGVFQFSLLFLGMKLGMPAGLSSIVMQVQVFFTMGLAVAFAGDRLQRHQVQGAAIGAAGLLVLAAWKLAHDSAGTFTGFALVVLAAMAWGTGNIIAKRGAGDHGADMFALVVWSSLVPPLPLAALSYLFEGGPAAFHAVVAMSGKAWACVAVMAYGATLFGFGTWNALLHRYPTPLISPFGLLIPVTGLASGALFLGETLAPVQAVGAALVLAGLAVNVYGLRIRAWLARER